MKEFFKYVLATVCGIITLCIFAGIIMMISFAGMVASGNATTEIKENSVLVLKLNGAVNERSEDGTPFDALLGAADMSSMGLDDILFAIKKAKENDDAYHQLLSQRNGRDQSKRRYRRHHRDPR